MADPLGRLNAALVDRFHLEREVGRGGMATVYLAQDLKHHRPVAMKVLLPELFAMVGAERFLREIEVEATLRHPHILPLLDSGEADGLLWYTMPFVEGESLRDRLRREKQLSLHEALRIGGEVAEALAYSHSHGVVHRDIKPSNILLDSDHAVVTDFGIALMVRGVSTDRLTQSGLSPGSPEYMSPEQAAGEHDVDSRSDVYSLGCVLYEMLAGDPPFTGSMPQAILAKKLMEPVPSVRVVRDTVPAHVERTVSAALAKSPADRLRSAEDFRRGLDGELEGLEEMAAAASHPSPAASTSIASRFGMAGLAAEWLVGLGVLVTTIGFLSTRVFDLKLNIPPEHTLSRADFLVVGAKALVPAFVYCLAAAVLYQALRLVYHIVARGLEKVPTLERTLVSVQRRSSQAWLRFTQTAEMETIFDLYFVASVVSAVVVLGLFRDLLAAMWTSDSEVLTCSYRGLHRTYNIVLPLLTAGLAVSWLKFVRLLRRRRVSVRRVAVAKWGGLAWVVLVAIVMTLPWRLLWDNEHPRVLFDGEAAYVLSETDAEWVIYRPATQITEQLTKGDGHQVERLGTSGYLYEPAAAFLGPDSGC